MIPEDAAYLAAVIDAGLVRGPCLELGAGIPDHSARSLVTARGIEYRSTDLAGDVDYCADFERPGIAERIPERFAAVICANVLEHCFDPLRVLDAAVSLLQPGGTCVVIAPAVWPVHSYPIDCWRLLPDFYREYAQRRGLELVPGWFRFVETDTPVQNELPTPWRSSLHRHWSRAVHRVLGTSGRGGWSRPHSGIGAVYRVAR